MTRRRDKIPADDCAGILSLLALLDVQLFRQRDVIELAARALHWKHWYTVRIWYRLQRDGRIVRSGVPMNDRQGCRRFYWQRLKPEEAGRKPAA